MGVTYPGNVLALKPTTVHFHKGEFTVLLGLSGAGKSTLLRSLNHLVKPTTGKVVSGEFGELTNRRILRQHRSRTAEIEKGYLPKRAMVMVLEWANEHRSELMEAWNQCAQMQAPQKIEPLS
jgi:ABC-type phosphate/phosphonate transport system ATPase subunit